MPVLAQIYEAAVLLAVIVIAFPPIFELAHWLRG